MKNIENICKVLILILTYKITKKYLPESKLYDRFCKVAIVLTSTLTVVLLILDLLN